MTDGTNADDGEGASRRVVVAGGGTGGHLYPGIAVVEALEELDSNLEFAFVGTEDGIEARVIPQLDYDLHTMDVPPLKGRTMGQLLKGGLMLTKSGVQALRLVRRLDPALTISVGGYAAGPFTLAAALSGRPTALMEQNLEPGLTNGILDRVVDLAFLTYEQSREHFSSACRVTGNPVRRSIRNEAEDYSYEAPDESGPFRVLVTGGSGGARSLNERLPGAFQSIEAADRLEVRHQYGEGRKSEVEGAYEGFAGSVRLEEFIDDMAAAYRWCDLLVARAGGSTIAEILTFGLPSVLVPSPHVTDDQQTKNARAIAESGAAIMLSDQEIGESRTTRLLTGLVDNPVSLENIAGQARKMAPENAAKSIASACWDLI